jgi:transcriptional regulator with XRE-family HTH domain
MPKNLLYTLRTEKDLTLQQVAKQVGVQPPTLSKWENGAIYPSEVKLERLAKALDVDFETLEEITPRCMLYKCRMRVYMGGLCKTHFHVNNPRKIRFTMTDELKSARTLGKRLQLLRCQRALSMEQMAQTFGVTTSTIEAWEVNWIKPTLHMLIDIAAYFSVGTRLIENGVTDE